MKRALLLILLSALFIFSGTCKKKEDKSVETLLKEGVISLGEKEYGQASRAFSEALKISPHDPRAHFGLALVKIATLGKSIENIVIELGNIIAQIIGGISPPLGLKSEIPDEAKGRTLNDLVADVLIPNLIRPIEGIIQELEIPRRDRSWSLFVEHLTITIKFRDVVFWEIDLSGEYDAADANLLYAAMSAVVAIVKLIMSVDIHLEIGNILRVAEYISSQGGISAITARTFIMNIIPFILNDKETFLGIEPKRGIRYWTEEIPNSLIGLADSMINFYDYLLGETDDQADDIVQRIEVGESERGETFIKTIAFPTSSTFFYDKELTEKRGGYIDEKTGKCVKCYASTLIPPPDLKVFFIALKNSVEKGELISWRNIVEALSFSIAVFLKTGILDWLISSFISSVSSVGVPQGVVNQIFQVVNPGIVAGLITAIIPDRLKFNFKVLFSQPVALRQILPAWTSDNYFMLEWECLSDSPDVPALAESNPIFSFFCKYPRANMCFESSKVSCDINIMHCYESLMSSQDVGCIQYCGKSGECKTDKGINKNICLEEDGGVCKKFCVGFRIRENFAGSRTEFCEKTIRYADTGHFLSPVRLGLKVKSTDYSIQPDGLFSVFPYVAFQNPDIFGFLYIDRDFLRFFIPSIDERGYSLPTLFEINAFLQIVGRNLISTLSQLLDIR